MDTRPTRKMTIMKLLKMENQWMRCWKKFGSRYLSNRSSNLTADGFQITSYVNGILALASSLILDSEVRLTTTIYVRVKSYLLTAIFFGGFHLLAVVTDLELFVRPDVHGVTAVLDLADDAPDG